MENQEKKIHGIPLAQEVAQEIEERLENLRRVKRVELARGKKKIKKQYGNRYVIPKPLVYKVHFPFEEEMVSPPGNTYKLPKPLFYPVSGSSDLE